MKYLVMECSLSYAVVLDEEGRFLKVANCRYEVGQTLTQVTEMQPPLPAAAPGRKRRWAMALAAAAACLVLAVSSALITAQTACASIYMRINPQLRIDVNRADTVVDIRGINADGEALIEGYTYSRLPLETVMDELVARAVEMGYLQQGGHISLLLDAENEQWVLSHSDSLAQQLSDRLPAEMAVTVEITDRQSSDYADSDYGDSDYGDSDYGDSDYGDDSLYGDSGYSAQTPSAGETAGSGCGDGETDYGGSDYAVSDYSDSDYGASDSDYDSDDSDDDDDDASDSDYGGGED